MLTFIFIDDLIVCLVFIAIVLTTNTISYHEDNNFIYEANKGFHFVFHFNFLQFLSLFTI